MCSDLKMTHKYEDVLRIFEEFGLELLTTQLEYNDHDIEKGKFTFVFRGPCGHIREGSWEETMKMCSVCVKNTLRVDCR